MKYFTLFSLICCISVSAFAQFPVRIEYRNEKNPLYWKNRKPHAAYWQQDVNYEIKATLDDKTDIITANEVLVYSNNSPDALPFVYFHLYQNAFQPGSYFAELNEGNKQKPRYGRYEAQGLGTKIESITVNGVVVKTELDNTILKVFLPEPLLPGITMV